MAGPTGLLTALLSTNLANELLGNEFCQNQTFWSFRRISLPPCAFRPMAPPMRWRRIWIRSPRAAQPISTVIATTRYVARHAPR